ncbi:hypothetical protein EVAR_39577_1 [Eumeta japonica]|uniref:HTH psq-type domain-containing protein n=1 Tax=Eumeta variegata TaxID=151549 RepID=A0A4C1XMZ6_EUMVA|nr:hypothetical protein EVAR_39577_1 [Eumeta japonica]
MVKQTTGQLGGSFQSNYDYTFNGLREASPSTTTLAFCLGNLKCKSEQMDIFGRVDKSLSSIAAGRRENDVPFSRRFNMPRVHKRKTNRGLVSDSLMLRAAREVKIYAKSIRSVAKDFGINYRTLTRYCKKFTSEEISNTAISRPSTKIGYQRNRQIFTDEQEEELEKFLLLASSIYFGLSPKEVRKIAFQLAMSNNLIVPKAWKSNKLAGSDWFTSF